jgi:hypothetical protein
MHHTLTLSLLAAGIIWHGAADAAEPGKARPPIKPAVSASSATALGAVDSSCTFKGKKLWGKVQKVTSFPDIKVQKVTSFPDLKVQKVTSFPDKCGQWQFVTSFPDIKIQFVTSFPDVKIQFVTSFPGVP